MVHNILSQVSTNTCTVSTVSTSFNLEKKSFLIFELKKRKMYFIIKISKI